MAGMVEGFAAVAVRLRESAMLANGAGGNNELST
jgi:hypothetical protein